jgi:hypothetical protein
LRCIRDTADAAGKGTLSPAPTGAHSAFEVVLNLKYQNNKGRCTRMTTECSLQLEAAALQQKYLQNFVIKRAELRAAENIFADIFIVAVPDNPLRC